MPPLDLEAAERGAVRGAFAGPDPVSRQMMHTLAALNLAQELRRDNRDSHMATPADRLSAPVPLPITPGRVKYAIERLSPPTTSAPAGVIRRLLRRFRRH